MGDRIIFSLANVRDRAEDKEWKEGESIGKLTDCLV